MDRVEAAVRGADPEASGGRLEQLDVLRGVALLGILLMNVHSFATIAADYLNPAAIAPPRGPDLLAWAFTRLVADQKFLGIFAMLFGAGLTLYHRRAEAAGLDAARYHRRRMVWLALFGLLHAALIWHGDVLFCYGVCGLLVAGARRLPTRRQLALALAVGATGSLLWLLGGATLGAWPEALVQRLEEQAWRPSAQAVAAEIAAYRGGWLEQMSARLPQALDNELGGLLTATGWKASSLMLVGMALMGSGVLDGRAPRALLWRLVGIGLGLGLPLTLAGALLDLRAGFSLRTSFFFGMQFTYWGAYGVGLGWLGLVLLALRAPWSARGLVGAARRRLGAVGRMAFSNYILHSVLGTLVFYGHGLGLFARLSRVEELGVVALLWTINLTISPWWLARYRQGPLEWIWRGLVRGRLDAPQNT